MAARSSTLCFGCGQPVGDPPILNLDASGEPCATCRDRVLEQAPSLLPGRGGFPNGTPRPTSGDVDWASISTLGAGDADEGGEDDA